MNVTIFNAFQNGNASYRSVVGKQFLLNTSVIMNVVAYNNTETECQFNTMLDPRLPQALRRWIVEGDLESINQSISGNYNADAVCILTPSFINGRANTTSYTINTNLIRYGWASDSSVVLKVLNYGRADFETWTFASTNLTDVAQIINGAVMNQVFSVTFGLCGTSTQAITYDINQDGTLLLEAFNGAVWATIDSDAVSAGSGSHTFSFDPGDLVSGQGMRVTLKVGTQYHPITTSTFACTGGSGSGSGSTGDCNMYAYFDGDGYNNDLKLLNWGASCTLGYIIQISDTNDNFADSANYVINAETKSHEFPIHLANGTYYARVRNISGQTRFSPTLTFTVS